MEIAMIAVLVLLNLVQVITNQIDRIRTNKREMQLIKAIIADNVQELAASEESPIDTRKRMKIENDLAENAAKLQANQPLHIPVG